MKRLFIMCGMAFSGKTTVARQLVGELGCAYVGLDEINAERGLSAGDGVPNEDWERTHEIARERMTHLMKEGRSIVLDDTSCFRWLRDRYREFALQSGYTPVVVYLDVPVEEIRLRVVQNVSRPKRGSIQPEILDDHISLFERPESDEAVVRLTAQDDISGWIDSKRIG